MEQQTTKRVRSSVTAIAFFLMIITIFVLCGVFSYRGMQNSLYKERTSNVEVLTDKTTQSVEIAMRTEWGNIHHFRNMFEVLQPIDGTTIDGAREILAKMRSNHPDGGSQIARLFLMDEDLYCYQSTDSTPELWRETEEVDLTKDACFISYRPLRAGSEQDAHMFFISPLQEQRVIEGKTFVAIAMAVEMSFIEPAFDAKDFGEDTVAFIVRTDGRQVYVQNKEDELSKEKDIVQALTQSAGFTKGVTAEDFKNALKAGEDGCIFVRYKGENYYVCYHAFDPSVTAEGRMALFMIPYENVSTGTRTFMRTIVVNTLVIAAAVVAVVAFFIYLVTHRYRGRLLAAAEAERSANQAKTQFLSAMSHDIRTPMNAIVGMTTLASKRLDEEEYVKSCLHKISLASSHLLTLINDILDITKVESGKMALNPIAFSLTDTVSNLINVVRPLVQEKLHEFEFHVHNICIENVYADQLRLNQILINLLSNAVKYTPEGGKIIVNMREERVEENPAVVRLIYVVEDNGVGMSEEFQKTMYQSFARERQRDMARIQGTGLGLTICKQMVDLMGGKIECDSHVGFGTKFTVTLDLLVADNQTETLTFAPTEVLLVDDDCDFLLSATDTLLQLGLLPDCVESGEAAIRAVELRHAQNNDYPLVIIDWKMPNMDGLETARQIRQKIGDDVPIIVISAYDTEEIEKEAKAIGVNGFINKPFFRSTVYDSLKPLLETNAHENAREVRRGNSLRGMRILVAEDNELNWEIAKDLLAMYGVITVRAENGQACLDIMESTEDGDYDLILMDIQMPIMNGYDTTKALRASSRKYLREIPIIAMTADAFSENIQQCKEVGMNGHIAKPVDIKILIDAIERRGEVTQKNV